MVEIPRLGAAARSYQLPQLQQTLSAGNCYGLIIFLAFTQLSQMEEQTKPIRDLRTKSQWLSLGKADIIGR